MLDEFRRNRVGPARKRHEYFNQEYIPGLAHEKATKKALKQRQKAPLKEPDIFLYVREHLREPFFWTPEQIQQLKKLAEKNTPTGLIADATGRTPEAVRSKASEEDISLKPINKSPYNRRKK